MRNFYKILLAVFLLPALSYAQSNYKPGYVVNLKGDTLHGYINYKEWDKNPESFAFKRELNQSDPGLFTTKNVEAFAIIEQLYYERHVVSVSQDAIELSALAPTLDTAKKTDTVFLRILNKGRFAVLYSYKDDLKTRFYLKETGQIQPYELVYHAYYNKDQSEVIQYVRRFRAQLVDLAQRTGTVDESLGRRITQGDYSESDLRKIVQNINGISSTDFTTANLFGVRFFAGVGVSYTQSKFTGPIEFTSAPVSKNTAPAVEAGMDFLINKNIQKLYLRVEAAFTYGQYSFLHSATGPAQGTTSLSFKLYDGMIVPQFVYNVFNKEQLKFFIDAGIGLNFVGYNDYKTITTYESFPPTVQDKYPDFESFYFSFPFKAGLEVNKNIQFYAGFIPAASIDNHVFIKNAITTYQAGLNYLFK